jgi:uncharacterized repeat protein (TIGR01451 family)
MHVQVSVVLASVSLALAWFSADSGTPRGAPAATLDRATRTRVVETLAQQPLRFEANAGQFARTVRYAARGVGYGVALTRTGAMLRLGAGDRAAAVSMRLIGRDGRPVSARNVSGRDQLPGIVNHYLGVDPSRWRTGVGQFARVRHTGVYDGIDLEFYGNQQRLEYDFLVAPGGDPAAIRIRFDGASRLEIDGGGDLLVHVDGGAPLRQHAPVSYQTIDGVRRPVASRYVRLGARDVGFALGVFDRSAPLTIDPVLAYSTYFGGTSEENIHDIALDPAGNIYVTGRSQDLAGFPTTTGAFQPTKPGATLTSDAFVSKFNPAGSALIYSTFLGGSLDDNNRALRAGRVAVDAAGNAYVTGDTLSANFPVSGNAADGTFGGGANATDGFYVKLGPTGAFLYGTFIGGTDIDWTHGIDVDAAGNVYVMGATRSDSAEGFSQTANAFSGTLSGIQDAFLIKFDANGARAYSTFVGGTGQENSFLSVGGGVVADDDGRAYVAGETPGPGFPIVGGFQSTFGGQYDAFLAVIDTTQSGTASLVYSTYLGGTGQDFGYDIAFAGNRQVVLVGEAAPGFPVLNAIDATHNGGNRDVFVAKFDTSLTGASSLLYSTYIGGSDYEFAWDVAVDPLGAVHVVGETRSTNFPAVNPIRTNFFLIEPFVFKINAAGTALVYSTLFGIESNYKQVRAVATNAAGDTFIAGGTNDTNSPTGPTHFPRVSPFQSTYGGGDSDGLIARIANGVDLLLTKTAAPEPVATGGTVTYTLTVTNSATDPAISVTVTDPLPTGVTFASCSATGGGTCGGSGNVRTITYPSLAAGASSTITITATVTAAMGAALVNTATVTTASFEPNTANNTATATSHTPGANPNDTDNDALPNDWETRFGLDSASGAGDNGAGGDPDGDGRTNFQELAEGSHPRGFVITYLAEGATGTFFDTRLALANPTGQTARVLCRYQKDDGTVVADYRTMAPMSRLTIDVDGVTSMASAAFSSLIEADVQIVADRTMTWGAGGYGSHAERGVLTRTATTWYLAEGATHGNFDLFYLIQNPGPVAAQIEIAYLRPAPNAPIVRPYAVQPNSRLTIRVDDVPGLSETDVSAAIRSTNTVPIIVERAMYFSRPDQVYAGGHESAGVTAAATRWFLAEGATGSFFNMFILIANPSTDAATVQMDYLLTNGQTVTVPHTVAANSRLTLNVAEEAPPLASANMSTVVTSTNAVPIVVERAMWWPAPGFNWQEAHNSPGEIVTGTRWAVGEGESGGAQGTQTYLLIANTSTFAGSARVVLLFEDGTTTEKVFALPASSRTNVSVEVEFPTAFGRRFGALIETQGGTPAQIVVERAMYSNANGIIWAAGTNALATKLQ